MQQPRPPVDMIAPLLSLPSSQPFVRVVEAQGVGVRRAKVWEAGSVRKFIEERLVPIWAEEAAVAFANKPISALIAFDGATIVGFAVYECTFRGLFGPIGVDEAYRERGIGAALLMRCLEAMREMGYIYAIIGQAGPREFFEKVCGAIAVPEHWPSYLKEGN
jgi:GNAT superfamily N-acetyltransferase